ncbi:MAG: hypothetical protein JJ971_10545 [Balneolaceae bacterium]|nr:hypothetical protein [Balneolaceae bacterium]MBO6546316.1 hypothetical protein [Balneolaceae bacterium]MBO6648675.1 hypothetical protein [Balneolaceae bacterium]
MTYETLFDFLLWNTVFNIIVLAWWSVWLMTGGDFVYNMHSRWFEMSREDFNKLHYFGLAFYKLMIILFNVVPLLVLWKMDGF